MKKALWLALLLFLILSLSPAWADSGDFVVTDHVLTQYNGTAQNVVIPSDMGIRSIGPDVFANKHFIRSITIPEGIQSIGDMAFSFCQGLTSLTLPSSLTQLGKYVFSGDMFLTDITIQRGLTEIGPHAFANASGLTTIAIPETVTSISDTAFVQCGHLSRVRCSFGGRMLQWALEHGLSPEFTDASYDYDRGVLLRLANTDVSTVYVPAELGMTAIADEALKDAVYHNFYGFDMVLPEGVVSIGRRAFYDSALGRITLPSTLRTLGEEVFARSTFLEEAILPTGVTQVPAHAFEQCYTLSYVYLPDTVTFIGDSAFASCYDLENITLPPFLATIGESAFYSCDSLTIVIIPDGVTRIPSKAFGSCTKLELVYIPDSVTYIAPDAFDNDDCAIQTDSAYAKSWAQSHGFQVLSPDYTVVDHVLIKYNGTDTDVVIPAQLGLREIADYAFEGNTSARSITIPYGVTAIGSNCFRSSRVERISLPDSVSSIGMGSFIGCVYLTDINIPASLTKLDHLMFWGCAVLKNVVIGPEVREMADDVFEQCPQVTISCYDFSYAKDWAIAHSVPYRLIGSLPALRLPAGLKEIAPEAFRGALIERVVCPIGLTSIGSRAFANCPSLFMIQIPASVTYISPDAFQDCAASLRIYGASGSAAEAFAAAHHFPFVAQ